MIYICTCMDTIKTSDLPYYDTDYTVDDMGAVMVVGFTTTYAISAYHH